MLRLHPNDALQPALDVLARPDGVLLAPTETVYGLLCAESHPAARNRIYELKQRPANKLLANFVPSIETVREFVPVIPGAAIAFAKAFCPGPVTLVIPDGKGGTWGFRIPDHPFVLALLRAYGKAITSTSANLSGTPPALSVPQALRSLAGEVDLAVDGGEIPADSKASTVIVIDEASRWKIVRPGPVTADQLESVWPLTQESNRHI